MTLNYNFLQTGNEDWTEANWHKVAMMLNGVNGVLEDATSKFAVTQNTPEAQNVIVGTGYAWVNGIEVDNTAPLTVTVSAADATNDRYDYIVIEVDWSAHAVTIKAVAGTPAASPVAPTLTQTDGVLWQFPLELIKVRHGSSSIEAADLITDERKYLFGSGIAFVIDGGGQAIAAGTKGYLPVLFDCTIASWEILPDVTGSIVLDVLKGTYATHPTYTSIVASDKPTVTAAAKATGSALSGWTTALKAGDRLSCVVDSCTTITNATLILHLKR